MLQYGENLSNEAMLERRNKVLKVSEKLSLNVVDTLQHLEGRDPKQVWRGHHTPFGNQLVCEYLYETFFVLH